MENQIQNNLKADLLDNAPVAIMFHDLDRTIQWANKTCQQAIGLSLEEITGKKCYSVWGFAKPCRNCPVMVAIETGESAEAELTAENQKQWPHDQREWLSRATPIRDANGIIIGAVETVFDFTEHITRRRHKDGTTAALLRLFEYATTHTAQELLQKFLDEAEALTGSQIGFYHFVEDDQVTLSLQMWSTNTMKMCTASGAGTFYPIQKAGVWVDCVRQGAPVIHNDYASLPHKKGYPEGHVPVVRELVVPVIRGGKLVAILGVGNKETDYDEHDISVVEQLAELAWETVVRKRAEQEREKLQARLNQAQKMEAIGTLAGGIAHDFNNILTAIVGFTEMAMDEVENDSLVQDNLQEVLKAGRRAQELVRQIRTFSRQTIQERKPINVKHIAKEVLQLMRASLPATIEIRDSLQSSYPVDADPTQIHQVLMNLCTNAGHAMQEKGGTLTVELSDTELDSDFTDSHPNLTPGSYLKLTVSDTGCGMPAHILERIFDPFFTTKANNEGTGMGLSVVHGIVKSHGGTIIVYSEPGYGTAVNVFLPVFETEIAPEETREDHIPTGTERILFIDDEKALVKLGSLLLESLGYEVTTRTASLEALELFKAQPDRFDLVITDMTMPNMTGDKMAEEMMRIRADIPIILCTGFSAKIDEKKEKAMGIRAFVLKPIIKSEIARKIRMALDQSYEKTY